MLFIYALSAQHHPWFVGWVERSGTHRLRGALAVPVGYASFHPPYEPEVFVRGLKGSACGLYGSARGLYGSVRGLKGLV